MGNRLDLHAYLKTLLGSSNVYYQPPESIKMKYPAIRYKLKDIINRSADDSVYSQKNAYEVIVIDPNPDSLIRDKISRLPLCSFDRGYAADNLNHYVFTLYY